MQCSNKAALKTSKCLIYIGADTDVDKPHSQDPPKLHVSHMTERWGGATY